MSAMMRLPWQRPLPSNDALYIQQLWASRDRTREPILMKFGKQTQIRTTMSHVIKYYFIKFKMADGRHVGKYSKCHNSPTNSTESQVGWSHHITFPTCFPRFGCYGNSRYLATAHWTFCIYGRLEAERVNQFWWNLVRNSKLGLQLQSWDQNILKFLKFKMPDGRHVGNTFEMP